MTNWFDAMLFRAILAATLLVLAWVLLYHESSGTLEAIQQEEITLYMRTANGHLYPAAACQSLYPAPEGLPVIFTAVGLDVFIDGQQILAPVIIRCALGYWMEPAPLP